MFFSPSRTEINSRGEKAASGGEKHDFGEKKTKIRGGEKTFFLPQLGEKNEKNNPGARDREKSNFDGFAQ